MLAFGFGYMSSFLLIFFIHLLVFSILLLYEGIKTSDRSSRWLSFLLLLCSLYISPFMFGYAGWYAKEGYVDFLFYTPLQQILLIGPATYFYIKSLLVKDYKFTRLELLHFVPGIVYNFYIVLIFILDLSIYNGDHFYANGRDKDLDLWYQICGFISMMIYFGLSLNSYNYYRRRIYDVVSYADEITLTWVGRFLVALLGLLVLRLLFFILNPEWAEFGSKFWYYASFSIIFYFIAIFGYRHSIKRATVINIPIPSQESFSLFEDLKTAKQGSDPMIEDLDQWKSHIDNLMRKKRLFISPQLSLLDLAKELNTNARNISQIINNGYDLNFNDFINQYRSQEMVEKIHKDEHLEKTLLSLAFECGFNSKSTFNRAFKKYTGKTPMQFIKDSQ